MTRQIRINIYLVICFIFISMPAFAHEETCSFVATLTDVKRTDERAPQTEKNALTATVFINKATSAAGKLSYLDCQHWKDQSLKEVTIVTGAPVDIKKVQKSQVNIRFIRRTTSSGEENIWQLE